MYRTKTAMDDGTRFKTPIPKEVHNTLVTKPWDEKKIEEFVFNGEYAMKLNYVNPVLRSDFNRFLDLEEAIEGKAVYIAGNILYRKDIPNVWPLIDLMIKATHEKKLSVAVDTRVNEYKGGQVIPTKITVFKYNGKLFNAYGRYIYGYISPYVRFANLYKSEVSMNKPEEDSFEEIQRDEWCRLPPKITNDEVILPCVNEDHLDDETRRHVHDHTYSFTIVDAGSQDLIAFCVYR